MSALDVAKEAVRAFEEYRGGIEGEGAGALVTAMRALGAALRKPVSFDMTAARKERDRIDAEWTSGDSDDHADAFHAARDLLDNALVAIDAGQAVPVAITDAMVEDGAILAWLAVWDGAKSAEDWQYYEDVEKVVYRRQARVVLEYYASLGGVATAAPVADVDRLRKEAATWERLAIERVEEIFRLRSAGPAGKCAADRLTDYRCAALTQLMSTPVDSTAYASGHALIKEVVDGAEVWAHAMLTAERSPTDAR